MFSIINKIILAVVFMTSITSVSCIADNNRPTYAMDPDDFFEDQQLRDLTWAAGRGDVSRINQLAEVGLNIDSAGVDGVTPLWWALQRQNKRGFERLLQLGADPNHFWNSGRSVMSHVPDLEDPYFLEMALEYGGESNLRNPRSKETPIFTVAKSPRSTVKNLEILLKAGAHMDVYDAAGFTPLIWSIYQDRYDLIYHMLSAGADHNLPVKDTELNLQFFMKRREGREQSYPDMPEWRSKVVELLLEKDTR